MGWSEAVSAATGTSQNPDGHSPETPAGGPYQCGPRLFDIRTGRLTAELVGQDGPVSAATFSPDGSRVAMGPRRRVDDGVKMSCSTRPAEASPTGSTRASHGVDVAEDGHAVLTGAYQLVREHDAIRERTLEIAFVGPGTEA